MPRLVILRLHPVKPVSADTFTTFLTGLTIRARDLTFADSVEGVVLGTASGLADPHLGSLTNNLVNVGTTSILQHYDEVNKGTPAATRVLQSAATAVIVVSPPAGHKEYPAAGSFDVRLEITRGGMSIVHDALEYNVAVIDLPAPLPKNQKIYFALPASAYVPLPSSAVGLDPSLAYVHLAADGTAPRFTELVKAIDLVLARDPGAAQLKSHPPLTAAQSRQVASEIVWNRVLYPPPVPARPLGELYTVPGSDDDAVERDRMEFEAGMAGYTATHDAEAMRLAGFVYAASAAVECERLSRAATRAGLRFPVVTGDTRVPEAAVVLTQGGPLNPSFVVPAAYFYTLGALLPVQIGAEQRFQMARLQNEPRLLAEVQAGIDARVIAVPAAPLAGAGPAINPAQAARRLHALGASTAEGPAVPLAPPVTALVTDWLAYAGSTETIDSAFWAPAAASRPASYLELILQVVTAAHTPLVAALKAAPRNVSTVAQLTALTDQQWRDLFLGPPPNVARLPPFTRPGTPAERAEAFIRHLANFFTVPLAPPAAAALQLLAPPLLGTSIADVFQTFAAAYQTHAGSPLAFGGALNPAALHQAAADVFPGDPEAQAWLVEAMETVDELFDATDVGAGDLHFSLMEALFARGFTRAAEIGTLTPAEFQDALTGTVAYPLAAAIHARAGAIPPPAPPAAEGFRPVNPDGSLTDCVPPLHLSPFGPVAYLAEMLRVSAGSTCDHPAGAETGAESLGALLAGRRGALGELLATRANLETPLPLIDLVNESLESLAEGLPGATGGAVYDTAPDSLAGHALQPYGDEAAGEFQHDPATLFAVLPEHSSPATPVAKPGAYQRLASDFTKPILPYHQPLDINRHALGVLGTTRFATARTFRRDIAEPALDPAHEPADFQRHLWRYPVRFPIALEYLHISAEEYELLYAHDAVTAAAPGRLLLRELFGFPAESHEGEPWSAAVLRVPEFMRRTGLEYCDFLELWRSGFVSFHAAGQSRQFPDCLPCCPDELEMEMAGDVLVGLRKLAVFIRLWRRLREGASPWMTFARLRDICDVLALFHGDAINPEFPRQLAAFLMLREMLALPLDDASAPAPGATGAERTRLLALWAPAAPARDWAVATLLEHIDAYAEARYPELARAPELVKLFAENLDPLSRLAGFDPGAPADRWDAHPTHTLRFVEVLAKIYTSGYTVGQLLFLFTPEEHLAGDDPFRLADRGEAVEDPLNLPEDESDFGLWELRARLLAAAPADEEAGRWSWRRIVGALRDELGFVPSGSPDPLDAFGAHFFPGVLEAAGQPVALADRQYRVALPAASTAPLMWNTPPTGPLHYDTAAEKLWAQLPIRDEAVVDALQNMRTLNTAEQEAVRDVYFAPRAELAELAFIFSSFPEAVDRLIHEPDEEARWRYFRGEFARFHQRCRLIAAHLAAHADREAGVEEEGGEAVAWKILRRLHADENFALTPWEDDAGAPPEVTWGPRPRGGAFAALLGLTGTGLLTEFSVQGTAVWREVSGALAGFGESRNEWNTPVPLILPALNVALTPDQQRFVVVRNGMALRNADGEPLGGAQPFRVRWTGVLMVEEAGRYRFHAGAPTTEGEEPDFAGAEHNRWRLTLTRGQKSWILLNRGWAGEDAPDAESGALALKRGAYDIVVEFEQREPDFARAEEVARRRCGFQVKYAGPDTGGQPATVPLDKLFRDRKTETLLDELKVAGAAGAYLKLHYTSTLRDIRRTYTRAFKAVLFARRFGLSARDIPGDRQSELGYMLDHAAGFMGTTHPRTGPASFGTHHAWLDFNLLPVTDPYLPPTPAQDGRQQPGQPRQAALFAQWERVWDYALMRAEAHCSRERPAWLLFYEASERQPDDPPQLVRHLGVDVRHAPLVLTYFATPAAHTLTTPELEDERWAMRVWQGEKWVRALKRAFFPRWIGDARPHLWASDDPGQPEGAPPESGNANLTRFVRDGLFENGPPRRFDELTRLHHRLRERARAALVAYLCGMDRVALPWGGHAAAARDLSDLLLQDVEAGTCQRASRIEEAVGAVQRFVQRARLGLEPGFTPGPAFALLWDRRFSSFRVWEACRRRQVYRENWIAWDEMEKARRGEAFQFLQSELRRATLTIPVPGGMEYWPGRRPPPHPGLTLLQAREPAGMRLLPPSPEPEGLDLMGTPERDARPSWLAPLARRTSGRVPGPNDNPDRPEDDDDSPNRPNHNPEDDDNPDRPDDQRPPSPLTHGSLGRGGREMDVAGRNLPMPLERLPLWIQAAVRLGVRFVRVAAAGVPPGSAGFTPRGAHAEGSCCVDCGRVHPPVMDEYYFWLDDGRRYSAAGEVQNADQGILTEGDISDWHRPERLPELLAWESAPTVYLHWSRFHNGEFQQRRRSDEGLHVSPSAPRPQLDFVGRTGDSLRFEVSGALPPQGHADPTPPGFRYDLATDSAVVLPLVIAPPAPMTPFPGGLESYPYFAYFKPGAPLLPLTVFSEASAVAGALRAHCRFEVALKWYELAFDPIRGDSTWAQCPPRLVPSPNNPDRPEPDNPDRPERDRPVRDTHRPDERENVPTTNLPARRRRADTACCPTAPVSDETARRRAITLEYLETLLQWGDALMCRNTPEAFGQATVVFDTMRRLLGARPLTIFARDDDPAQRVAAFTPRPAPLNPRLLSLYDRAADRAALVHHCLNARRLRNGTPNVDMPFFGDSPFHDGWKHSPDVCADDGDWCVSCCKPYRFLVLVQKALELASEVRSFGAALLAAYEKGDGEFLASMRATHERQLLALALEVRQNQWREADWQVQALQKTKEATQTRQRYYETLLANGLNAGELGYLALTSVSMASRTAGNVSEAIAQGMGMVPDMFLGVAGIMGTPLQFNQLPVGSKLAGGFVTAARILNAVADIANTGASVSTAESGWARRAEEWRHQVEVLGIEVDQIERQILASERRRDIASRELNAHQVQIENSTEVLDFLRDKFTSHELYLHLQQETAALHRRMYELAVETARQAQRAFNYERGYTARAFLPTDGWDGLHESLLAGDRLQLAVRQMEKAYYNENCREYELTKHLSLRLHFPEAFLRLQTTGYCEIDVPEWMFDLDYPGHYMRRIRSASVTVPAVVGPYTGVHCRLTLLSSTTRRDPRLGEAPAACCSDCARADGYEPLSDDPRIVKSYAATEAIATSGGQNDAGLFELSFHDERYLPFEFAGAVSRWRIELPPENNGWPAETLSDFVIHLNYLAREGGDVLRRAANAAAQRHLPDDGMRLFNVRNELPDAWQSLRSPAAPDRPRELRLRLGRAMFPYLPRSRGALSIHRVDLFLEVAGAAPGESLEVDFFEPQSHAHGDAWYGRHTVVCVASAEWPHLYHGVLDLPLGSLDEAAATDLGAFRLPARAGAVERAFLLCGYTAAGVGARCSGTAGSTVS